MIHKLQRFLAYLTRIPRTRGFGIQSPWSYQFVQTVVRPNNPPDFEQRLQQYLAAQGIQPDEVLRIDSLQINSQQCKEFLQQNNPKRLLIVDNIHSTKQHYSIWEKLVERQEVVVSFDLWKLGLCFFLNTTTKQHYRINI